MKTIYNNFDKNAIPALPLASFPGRIVVVQTPGEAERAVDFLLSCDILGVDTETRPSFKKGVFHKVSLLQVSTHDICFLFRLNMIGLTPAVVRLLENTQVPMVGLSWHDDILSLHKRGDFTPGRFLDIQDLVGHLGIEDMSLQKIYANVFHERINKRQRLSNWDADVLNDKQKLYAATDAWACVMLYDEIRRLEETRDYQLVVIEKEEPIKENNEHV